MTNILSLSLNQIEFVVSDNEDWRDRVPMVDTAAEPIPLAGIDFVMSVRSHPLSHEQLGKLSTYDLTLVVGGAAGNELIFAYPREKVKNIGVGKRYVDCIAYADGATVRVIRGSLEVEKGIVQP